MGRISIKASSLYLLFDIEEHRHNHKYCKKSEFSIKDIICDCGGLALGVLTLIL